MPRCREVITSLAIVLSGLVTVAAVWAGLGVRREEAHRAACANTLRQVGLAAMQYGDARRFLPFAGDSVARPSGGVESTASIRITRALVSDGLLVPGDVQVCPASADAVPDGGSTWLAARPGSPMVERPDDPTLREVRDLSYGWTRRARSANCRCTAPLAADRAVRPAGGAPDPDGDPLQGDHVGGLNVVSSDGSVRWTAADDLVAAELLGGGASGHVGLGIADPTRPIPLRPARARWASHLGEWLLLLPLGVVGLAVLLRAGPPPPAPARGLVPVRPSAVVPLASRPDLSPPGAALHVHPGQRCPWCHAGLLPGQPLTACRACRTAFHADCAAPGAACTTLGCAG